MGIERTGHLNPPSLGGRELEGGLAPSPRPSPSRGEGVSPVPWLSTDDEATLLAAFKALVPAASLFVPLLFTKFANSEPPADDSDESRFKKAISEAVKGYAARLNEKGLGEGVVVKDIEKFRSENAAAAEGAMKIISAYAQYAFRAGTDIVTIFMDEAADLVHEQWLKRNGSWAPPEQNKPYSELSEDEQNKDRIIVLGAVDYVNKQLAAENSDIVVVLIKEMGGKDYIFAPQFGGGHLLVEKGRYEAARRTMETKGVLRSVSIMSALLTMPQPPPGLLREEKIDWYMNEAVNSATDSLDLIVFELLPELAVAVFDKNPDAVFMGEEDDMVRKREFLAYFEQALILSRGIELEEVKEALFAPDLAVAVRQELGKTLFEQWKEKNGGKEAWFEARNSTSDDEIAPSFGELEEIPEKALRSYIDRTYLGEGEPGPRDKTYFVNAAVLDWDRMPPRVREMVLKHCANRFLTDELPRNISGLNGLLYDVYRLLPEGHPFKRVIRDEYESGRSTRIIDSFDISDISVQVPELGKKEFLMRLRLLADFARKELGRYERKRTRDKGKIH